MTLSVRLQHRFNRLELDVEFDAPAGLTVLFGRSGSGKTTIVNAVAGLLRPDAGRVEVDGRVLLDTSEGVCLRPEARRLGYVFQEGRLFPHLTVWQNLGYGRYFAKRRKTTEPGKVIAMLGLEELLDRRPGALSGGEKQRVAIGRALLAEPELILADEPLAALDEARKAEILPYFERLRDEARVPILYVSHAPAEVARLATSVVALQDGRVARQGPAVEVLADANVLPAGVRGAGAMLHAVVVAHHDDGLSELEAGGVRLHVPRVAQQIGASIRLRVPAQEVILAKQKPEGLSALNILAGTVEAIREGGGPGAIVSLSTPAGRVLARITRRSARAMDLKPGSTCHAVLKTVAIAPEDVGGA
ncbi:molybdenum ABC transporter ATP-binding protein [Pacificoceanicola onchidii]|uniref:molybdenum ABC transporter ATP-binding protein n=1 Tax=Pacificoceanicola onchidii TaxID=2562685 RepID=UPI0010A5F084|nr:molybdenum ABC transporter ATP-binding protein [Pacificoceanicola onchidii]